MRRDLNIGSVCDFLIKFFKICLWFGLLRQFYCHVCDFLIFYFPLDAFLLRRMFEIIFHYRSELKTTKSTSLLNSNHILKQNTFVSKKIKNNLKKILEK